MDNCHLPQSSHSFQTVPESSKDRSVSQYWEQESGDALGSFGERPRRWCHCNRNGEFSSAGARGRTKLRAHHGILHAPPLPTPRPDLHVAPVSDRLSSHQFSSRIEQELWSLGFRITASLLALLSSSKELWESKERGLEQKKTEKRIWD